MLIFNTPKSQNKQKETNWKQKSQKPHNENICLTNLNTEMNGNFPIFSFGELRNEFVREEKEDVWQRINMLGHPQKCSEISY